MQGSRLSLSVAAAYVASCLAALSDYDPSNPHVGQWYVLDNTGLGELDEASQAARTNNDGTAEILTCGFNWLKEDGNTYSYDFGGDSMWRSDKYPPRPHILNHQGTIMWNNNFILFGGCTGDGKASTDIVQSLDTDTKVWSLLAPLPYLTCAPLTTVIGDKAYVCGGLSGGFLGGSATIFKSNINTCVVYDLVSNSWTTMAQPIPFPRNHGSAQTDGEKLYIIGGREFPMALEVDETVVQIYDPLTQTWLTSRDAVPNAPAPISPGRAGIYRCPFHPKLKEFICCGGEINSAPTSVYSLHGIQDGTYYRCDAFNPALNTWRRLSNIPRGVGDMYIMTVGWDIYVAGGSWHKGQGFQGNPFYRMTFPTLGEGPNYGSVPPAGVEHTTELNTPEYGYDEKACVVGSKLPICTGAVVPSVAPVAAEANVNCAPHATGAAVSSLLLVFAAVAIAI